MSDYENVNTTPDYENVKADYTPTTERVRNSYANDIACFPKPENVFEANARAEAAKEEFDRWLASVKAEAWDEGYVAGVASIVCGAPLNPYREVSGD